MAHLDDVITNNLTGETSSYEIATDNTGKIKVEFRQFYTATQDIVNFKWKIKVALYVKMLEDTSTQYSGIERQDILMDVGGEYIYLSTGTSERGDTSIQHFEINQTIGVKVNGVVISNNAWTDTKILEYEFEFPLNRTGRYGIRLRTGEYFSNNQDTWYYPTDYSFIYYTFPSFSGLYYKKSDNHKYIKTMPYLKINGEWKPVLQYMKIDNVWVQSTDNWIWNPT